MGVSIMIDEKNLIKVELIKLGYWTESGKIKNYQLSGAFGDEAITKNGVDPRNVIKVEGIKREYWSF
jgi:hypothetical protein